MKYATGVVCCLMITISSALADVTETKKYDFELREGGRLSLSNVNGDIHIEGIPGNQVHVVATKKAGSQEYLDGIEIEIESTDELVRIETRHPKSRGQWLSWRDSGSGSVSYEVQVPDNVQLDTIESVNGDIQVTAVHGSVNIETINGKMTLAGLAGDAKLDTVNGAIDAQFDALGGAQRISADAVNGRILLRFPEDASARVHAETINGGIEAGDFGLLAHKGFVGRDLDGDIGNGEARVHIDTVNGSVTVQRNK